MEAEDPTMHDAQQNAQHPGAEKKHLQLLNITKNKVHLQRKMTERNNLFQLKFLCIVKPNTEIIIFKVRHIVHPLKQSD